MKNDVLQLMFGSLALVLGAGCEELLPKVFGVGFPILLMIVVFLSVRFGLLLTVFLAIAAGALEDAVSSLTPMTSVSAFLIVAVLVRRFGLPYLAAMLVFPCYQLWLSVWMGGLNDSRGDSPGEPDGRGRIGRVGSGNWKGGDS